MLFKLLNTSTLKTKKDHSGVTTFERPRICTSKQKTHSKPSIPTQIRHAPSETPIRILVEINPPPHPPTHTHTEKENKEYINKTLINANRHKNIKT